ncbi:MAG: dihydrolipoyl dehydrogenase [Trueperaceae bacterium]|nr:dihydrolipoyl dehydrogenase [Trueperaceae bacterium]
MSGEASGAAKAHDIVIIGAGPGGYVAALRAAQLGFDVGLVEKESALGGTCVRVGCIPSKALLESSFLYTEARHGFAAHGIKASVELDLAAMQARREKVVKQNTDGVAFLMKKNKITVYLGAGRLAGPGAVNVEADGSVTELQTGYTVLATGSVPSPLRGVDVDGETVITSTEVLELDAVPERLVVIGAGVIGLELGSVWARLGSKVTVVEYLDRILPGTDLEIAKEAQKLLGRQGLEFKLGAKVSGVEVEEGGKGARVLIEGQEPLVADKVLVCVGRRPATAGLGLEEAGVALDKQGRVIVDEGFATNVHGVYAIGDLIHGPMLAHKAEEDGVALVERLAGHAAQVHYDLVPGIVYTEPEIATVGATEEQLKEAGTPYRKGTFPFTANGRARALGHTDGRVKVLAHQETDRILGVHIIGPRAGDLIAEAVTAMTFGASSEDLARTIHAHPTLSEALKEAALAVDGRALHS